jgi:ubiquinone/menaquinone biosynthesis C-methylase UbiE
LDAWDDGNSYERYVGRWSRKIGDAFLGWLAPPEGLAWLDLGCGTGALTAQILNRCSPAHVIGVEPSEDFLAAATRAIQDARAEFRLGGGETIPLRDAEVFFAVSGFALNFVPDQAAAMREQVRVVKPGGTVAAYVWDYAVHAQFIRVFWDAAVSLNPAARELDEGVRFPNCHPEALRSLFESAGLDAVEVAPIDVPTPFKDFEDYWTPFLSGIGPAPGYCTSLDEPAREALRHRLQETLPTDAAGRILLAARAWAVRGTR